MSVCDKLAVLIPVYNAGVNLAASVSSCAAAGLSGGQYELIVVDNCSTDGAVAALPDRDSGGAPIHVYRNSSNIGRTANWNRAVEIAIERGFTYITFLFAGDRWINGDALPELWKCLRDSDAGIAFGPFVVAEPDGRFKCASQRFYVNGASAVCSSHTFLTALLESGLFPLGPLQANIYRIEAEHRPVFDASQPTRTDVDATLAFVQTSSRPVVVGGSPFLEWRELPGRFHASMGTGRTIEDYMATFQLACATSGLQVNYGRAKTRVVLNSLRLMISDAPLSKWPSLIGTIAKCASRTPYRIGPLYFLETLWSRFALGRRLLQFG